MISLIAPRCLCRIPSVRRQRSMRCFASTIHDTAQIRMASRIVIAEEVQDRLQCGQPVIALESTVIAQGLPFPENLKLHERMVAMARTKGVTPATIGTWMEANGRTLFCFMVISCLSFCIFYSYSYQRRRGPSSARPENSCSFLASTHHRHHGGIPPPAVRLACCSEAPPPWRPPFIWRIWPALRRLSRATLAASDVAPKPSFEIVTPSGKTSVASRISEPSVSPMDAEICAPAFYPQGYNDIVEVLCSGEVTAGKLSMHFSCITDNTLMPKARRLTFPASTNGILKVRRR
jgi:Indigoidine synthase A like protein